MFLSVSLKIVAVIVPVFKSTSCVLSAPAQLKSLFLFDHDLLVLGSLLCLRFNGSLLAIDELRLVIM